MIYHLEYIIIEYVSIYLVISTLPCFIQLTLEQHGSNSTDPLISGFFFNKYSGTFLLAGFASVESTNPQRKQYFHIPNLRSKRLLPVCSWLVEYAQVKRLQS